MSTRGTLYFKINTWNVCVNHGSCWQSPTVSELFLSLVSLLAKKKKQAIKIHHHIKTTSTQQSRKHPLLNFKTFTFYQVLYLNHIQYFTKYGDHCGRNASMETTTKSTIMLFDKVYFQLQKTFFQHSQHH